MSVFTEHEVVVRNRERFVAVVEVVSVVYVSYAPMLSFIKQAYLCVNSCYEIPHEFLSNAETARIKSVSDVLFLIRRR